MNPSDSFSCAIAPKRNSRHWKNSEITWQGLLDWMATPDTVKEAGNYLLGTLSTTTVRHNPEDPPCTNIHRSKVSVVTRSAITLDLDFSTHAVPETLELVLSHAAILHTTFTSTTAKPRHRLIIPLDREIAPDEYVHAATKTTVMLGATLFDPSTCEPERYMFRPAAPDPRMFQSWVYPGPPASADQLLQDFNPDLASAELPSISTKRKRNPFDIDGPVGAFNRAYTDTQFLIEEYELPYAPAGGGRWHLLGSRAVAGMGEVEPGLLYSHHANDPAYGQTCTAFDVVRLHRFGHLDDETAKGTPINRLPSFQAMIDLAGRDARVTAEMVGADFDTANDDADQQDWKLALSAHLDRSGHLKDTAKAWDIVRKNDPVIRNIRYNEMTFGIETLKDLPWRTLQQGGMSIRTSDRLSMQAYLETEYNTAPTARRVDWMIDETAMKRYHNPVREWLRTLEWDGVPRLETCLPGVQPTEYTRMVARKSLVAAVARMMEPGCKWDHTMILYGKEGLGKTWWIEQMSRGWTAPLGMVGHKDTLINLQRCWIVTSDEGTSMRKSDADALKEFLTRRVDVFRLPYEREATAHPRHCVIWGTTNDEVFLRYQEGNRRFLIVRCEEKFDFSILTEEYITQVWAEAVYLYQMGEILLFLDPEESEMAAEHRQSFVEEGSTVLEGLTEAYLSDPLPADWLHRGMESRQEWLRARSDGLEPAGELILDEVCAIQVYVEGLRRPHGQHTRVDLLEIGKALRALGWTPQPHRVRCGPYGPQMVYRRPDDQG